MPRVTSGEAGQDHRLHIAQRGVELRPVEAHQIGVQRVAFGFQRDLVRVEHAGADTQPCKLKPHQRCGAEFAQPHKARRHGGTGACAGGFSLCEQGVGFAVEGRYDDDNGLSGADMAVGFGTGCGVIGLGGEHRAAEFQHAKRAGGVLVEGGVHDRQVLVR